MYQPSIFFERTPEQYRDPLLAWERPDIAFFGAGACHVLAFAFMQLHPNEGFEVVHIRPIGTQNGHHVYASNGVWAFDHNGWTQERELLTANLAAELAHDPGWRYDRVVILDDIETFCRRNNHTPPQNFPFSPWERAERYIQQFAAAPPS